MKKSVYVPFFLIISFFLLFSVSCTDMEDSTDSLVSSKSSLASIKTLVCDDIELSDFTGGLYCKKDVYFSGTLQKNKAIASVVAQIKWLGEDSFSEVAKAKITDETWTCEFSLKGEGVAFLRFVTQNSEGTALDSDSAEVITLFVSESSAIDNPWYINRENGNLYSLKTLETLKNLDLNLFENKNAAQNDSFTLSVKNSEPLPVKITSAKIYTENDEVLCSVQNSNPNEYVPSFKITQTLLENASETLASGIQYLKIIFNAEYSRSNTTHEFSIDGGYFIWWPEYDIPTITNAQIVTENSQEILNLSSEEPLTLTVYDDDGLSEVYCVLLTEEEFSSFGTIDWEKIAFNPTLLFLDGSVEDSRIFSATSKDTGEEPLSINFPLPSKAQTMHLLAIAFDSSSAQTVATKAVEVRVINDDAPIFSVDSPKNDSIPSVTMSRDNTKAIFKISGHIFDKVGCSSLELLWLPSSPSESESPVWPVALSNPVAYDSFYAQSFSVTLDLLSDFADEAALNKDFLAKVTRADGTVSYFEYTLLADSVSPEIVLANPSDSEQSVEIFNDFTIEFSAKKESALAIDSTKYAVFYQSEQLEGNFDEESQTYKAVLTSDLLKEWFDAEIQPQFTLVAQDIFGNTATSQITLVLTDVPLSVADKTSTASLTTEIATSALSFGCEDFAITSSATSSNKSNGITYLREGRTLTVTITANKAVHTASKKTEPTFDFVVNTSGTQQAILSLPLVSCSNKLITFSKKIEASDPNGSLFYISDSCISQPDYFIDDSGNTFSFSQESDGQKTDSQFVIDTNSPSVPRIISSSGEALGEGLYAVPVRFKIETDDADLYVLQYSTDGGSSWIDYSSEVMQSESAQITARAIDSAGNIAEKESPIDLNINGSFPSFTVECLSSDGNYKRGSTITFRVNFSSKVTCTENSQAKLRIAPNTYATLKDSKTQEPVTSLIFTYTVLPKSDFIPKIEADGVILSGVTDLYGNSQKDTDVLSEPIEFSNIVCDGILPVITKMAPESETSAKSNIFADGNKITLTFSEKIKKSSGKLILRQVSAWAIPPVLSEEQFNLISAAISSEDKEILSRQDSAHKANLQDSESIFSSKVSNYPNDTYHGTGVDVGPYKKAPHGLTISDDGSFVPDLSAKYVLDFDIDIWETDTVHYYDKTFESGFATKKKYADRVNYDSMTNSNVFKIVDPEVAKKELAKRTAAQIRAVLEKAHYHERILDVSSSDVEISSDGMTVTLTFRKNPYEASDSLPYGREWELAVEHGAFVDACGNPFDAEESSDYFVVKNANGKDSFYSDGVASPVVRVDRYSYGLGIWQSDKNGNKASRVVADLSTIKLEQPHDSIQPTGYVRVRVDCETKGAEIRYMVVDDELRPSDVDSLSLEAVSSPVDGNTHSPVFAAGNGDYKKACTQYVVARAHKNGLQSHEAGIEGVFQTVVQFANPQAKKVSCAVLPLGQQDLSIHGAIKSEKGEPSVSSFPLRISKNGSPYLRRCYRENTNPEHSESLDYYWLSYEILTDTVYSYYSWNSKFYSWSDRWGVMKRGERSIMKD
ncbi:MAG: hypothetical protein IJ158_01245 [Treponema sp.]|nr:hypothetical protein [Treponema sp.]